MLKLTSVAPTRAARTQHASEEQVANRSSLILCNQEWQTALSDEQRANFKVLGRQIAPKNPHSTRASLTGQQAYQKLNLVRLSCTMGLLNDAPLLAPVVSPLPEWAFSAAFTSGPNTSFEMGVTSAGFAGKVMVFVTRCLSPGLITVPADELRLLDVADALPDGTYSLSARFLARFGSPTVGMRIGIRLVPVSEEGWAGLPVVKSAIVGVTP